MDIQAKRQANIEEMRTRRARNVEEIETLMARRGKQLELYANNANARETILNDELVNARLRDLQHEVEAIDTAIDVIENMP